MKVLIYATSLGADLWAFAQYLDNKPEVDLKIILKDKSLFLKEGIARLYPFSAPMIDRKWYHRFKGIRGFKPDITLMDNNIPAYSSSENGLMLWHGFGWKGPNDEEEFKWLHRLIKWCWGSAKKPNANFNWLCFGPWDFEHRTSVSGFHPDNCKIMGAASHDQLIKPFDKSLAKPFYSFDVVNKPTVLFAPTWHYGEVFKHWGNDRVIFPKIIEKVSQKDANLLIRLHDSFRFDEAYVSFLKKMAREHPNVMLKFKDEHPDNILDLQISDMLITNYSSIANLFYATGKPTIHIYPVNSTDEAFMWRTHHLTGTRQTKVDSVKYIWKLPPEENGGVVAHDFDEMINQIEFAFEHPDFCKKKAQNFLNEYMLGADGKNCERIWRTMQGMVGTVTEKAPSSERELQYV